MIARESLDFYLEDVFRQDGLSDAEYRQIQGVLTRTSVSVKSQSSLKFYLLGAVFPGLTVGLYGDAATARFLLGRLESEGIGHAGLLEADAGEAAAQEFYGRLRSGVVRVALVPASLAISAAFSAMLEGLDAAPGFNFVFVDGSTFEDARSATAAFERASSTIAAAGTPICFTVEAPPAASAEALAPTMLRPPSATPASRPAVQASPFLDELTLPEDTSPPVESLLKSGPGAPSPASPGKPGSPFLDEPPPPSQATTSARGPRGGSSIQVPGITPEEQLELLKPLDEPMEPDESDDDIRTMLREPLSQQERDLLQQLEAIGDTSEAEALPAPDGDSDLLDAVNAALGSASPVHAGGSGSSRPAATGRESQTDGLDASPDSLGLDDLLPAGPSFAGAGDSMDGDSLELSADGELLGTSSDLGGEVDLGADFGFDSSPQADLGGDADLGLATGSSLGFESVDAESDVTGSPSLATGTNLSFEDFSLASGESSDDLFLPAGDDSGLATGSSLGFEDADASDSSGDLLGVADEPGLQPVTAAEPDPFGELVLPAAGGRKPPAPSPHAPPETASEPQELLAPPDDFGDLVLPGDNPPEHGEDLDHAVADLSGAPPAKAEARPQGRTAPSGAAPPARDEMAEFLPPDEGELDEESPDSGAGAAAARARRVELGLALPDDLRDVLLADEEQDEGKTRTGGVVAGTVEKVEESDWLQAVEGLTPELAKREHLKTGGYKVGGDELVPEDEAYMDLSSALDETDVSLPPVTVSAEEELLGASLLAESLEESTEKTQAELAALDGLLGTAKPVVKYEETPDLRETRELTQDLLSLEDGESSADDALRTPDLRRRPPAARDRGRTEDDAGALAEALGEGAEAEGDDFFVPLPGEDEASGPLSAEAEEIGEELAAMLGTAAAEGYPEDGLPDFETVPVLDEIEEAALSGLEDSAAEPPPAGAVARAEDFSRLADIITGIISDGSSAPALDRTDEEEPSAPFEEPSEAASDDEIESQIKELIVEEIMEAPETRRAVPEEAPRPLEARDEPEARPEIQTPPSAGSPAPPAPTDRLLEPLELDLDAAPAATAEPDLADELDLQLEPELPDELDLSLEPEPPVVAREPDFVPGPGAAPETGARTESEPELDLDLSLEPEPPIVAGDPDLAGETRRDRDAAPALETDLELELSLEQESTVLEPEPAVFQPEPPPPPFAPSPELLEGSRGSGGLPETAPAVPPEPSREFEPLAPEPEVETISLDEPEDTPLGDLLHGFELPPESLEESLPELSMTATRTRVVPPVETAPLDEPPARMPVSAEEITAGLEELASLFPDVEPQQVQEETRHSEVDDLLSDLAQDEDVTSEEALVSSLEDELFPDAGPPAAAELSEPPRRFREESESTLGLDVLPQLPADTGADPSDPGLFQLDLVKLPELLDSGESGPSTAARHQGRTGADEAGPGPDAGQTEWGRDEDAEEPSVQPPLPADDLDAYMPDGLVEEVSISSRSAAAELILGDTSSDEFDDPLAGFGPPPQAASAGPEDAPDRELVHEESFGETSSGETSANGLTGQDRDSLQGGGDALDALMPPLPGAESAGHETRQDRAARGRGGSSAFEDDLDVAMPDELGGAPFDLGDDEQEDGEADLDSLDALLGPDEPPTAGGTGPGPSVPSGDGDALDFSDEALFDLPEEIAGVEPRTQASEELEKEELSGALAEDRREAEEKSSPLDEIFGAPEREEELPGSSDLEEYPLELELESGFPEGNLAADMEADLPPSGGTASDQWSAPRGLNDALDGIEDDLRLSSSPDELDGDELEPPALARADDRPRGSGAPSAHVQEEAAFPGETGEDLAVSQPPGGSKAAAPSPSRAPAADPLGESPFDWGEPASSEPEPPPEDELHLDELLSDLDGLSEGLDEAGKGGDVRDAGERARAAGESVQDRDERLAGGVGDLLADLPDAAEEPALPQESSSLSGVFEEGATNPSDLFDIPEIALDTLARPVPGHSLRPSEVITAPGAVKAPAGASAPSRLDALLAELPDEPTFPRSGVGESGEPPGPGGGHESTGLRELDEMLLGLPDEFDEPFPAADAEETGTAEEVAPGPDTDLDDLLELPDEPGSRSREARASSRGPHSERVPLGAAERSDAAREGPEASGDEELGLSMDAMDDELGPELPDLDELSPEEAMPERKPASAESSPFEGSDLDDLLGGGLSGREDEAPTESAPSGLPVSDASADSIGFDDLDDLLGEIPGDDDDNELAVVATTAAHGDADDAASVLPDIDDLLGEIPGEGDDDELAVVATTAAGRDEVDAASALPDIDDLLGEIPGGDEDQQVAIEAPSTARVQQDDAAAALPDIDDIFGDFPGDDDDRELTQTEPSASRDPAKDTAAALPDIDDLLGAIDEDGPAGGQSGFDRHEALDQPERSEGSRTGVSPVLDRVAGQPSQAWAAPDREDAGGFGDLDDVLGIEEEAGATELREEVAEPPAPAPIEAATESAGAGLDDIEDLLGDLPGSRPPDDAGESTRRDASIARGFELTDLDELSFEDESSSGETPVATGARASLAAQSGITDADETSELDDIDALLGDLPVPGANIAPLERSGSAGIGALDEPLDMPSDSDISEDLLTPRREISPPGELELDAFPDIDDIDDFEPRAARGEVRADVEASPTPEPLGSAAEPSVPLPEPSPPSPPPLGPSSPPLGPTSHPLGPSSSRPTAAATVPQMDALSGETPEFPRIWSELIEMWDSPDSTIDPLLELAPRMAELAPRNRGHQFIAGALAQLQQHQSRAILFYEKALALCQEAHDRPNAGAVLEKLREILPADPGIFQRLAEAYVQQGRRSEACDLWLELGNRYLASRSISQAVASFEQARRVSPDDVDPVLGLASAHRADYNDVRAIEVLNDALGRNPQSFKLQVSKGVSLSRIGRARASDSCVDRGLELAWHDVGALGWCASALGNAGLGPAQARARQRILELDPSSPMARPEPEGSEPRPPHPETAEHAPPQVPPNGNGRAREEGSGSHPGDDESPAWDVSHGELAAEGRGAGTPRDLLTALRFRLPRYGKKLEALEFLEREVASGGAADSRLAELLKGYLAAAELFLSHRPEDAALLCERGEDFVGRIQDKALQAMWAEEYHRKLERIRRKLD